MNAPLFKRLTREEFARLNLTQKLIYLRALTREQHAKVKDERQTVNHENQMSRLLRVLVKRLRR